MRKIIFAFFVVVSALLLLLRFSSKLPIAVDPVIPAGLTITSEPDGATVIVNGAEVGQTPYKKQDMTAGDYTIELRKEDNYWKDVVTLNSQTLTVVNRTLSNNFLTSSGETISLEKGQGVTVISNPEGALVSIDGSVKGKTPLRLADLQPGEHQFILTHDHYESRSIRSNLPGGYQLNLFVNLSLEKPDPNTTPEPSISATVTVTVKDTPNGFLRVRSSASTTSSEVTRVNTGDKLTLLSETDGWAKIKTSEGKEGYVSSQYIEK